MFERNLWCLCSMYFSAPKVFGLSLYLGREKIFLVAKPWTQINTTSATWGQSPGHWEGSWHICRVINNSFLALLPGMGSCWWQQNRQGNLQMKSAPENSLIFHCPPTLHPTHRSLCPHQKGWSESLRGLGKRFTASYPRDEGSVSSWYLWVSCPLSPGLVERMRWEAAGFPNAESAWRPQQLKWPGGSHRPQGLVLGTPWVSVACHLTEAFFPY